MNQTSTIHSVETQLIYAAIHSVETQLIYAVVIFQAIQNIFFLILYLCHKLTVNSMKTRFAQRQSIVATPSVNHMK